MTYYQVTYEDSFGNTISRSRQYVQQAYLLYKDMKSENLNKLRLEEVSDSGIIVLRGFGLTPIDFSRDDPRCRRTNRQPLSCTDKSLFELMFGISKTEYKECLENFARLSGTNLEEWGLENF